MTSPKNVTIVIPAYNSQGCIFRAIESVLSQTHPAGEIIVVDDGSTDSTKDIVKGFKDKVRYIRQENAGVSRARNVGISTASGDWVGFLDADDEFLPDHLKHQIYILDRAPNLKWCAGNFLMVNGTRRQIRTPVKRIIDATTPDGYFKDYLRNAARKNGYVSSSTVLIHKSIFEEVGNFEEGRTVAEDVDLWWRIAHRFPAIGYVAEPITRVYLDFGETSFSTRRKYTKSGKDIREIIARHLEMARVQGDYDSFLANAATVLKARLLEMAFNGFHKEARETVRQFPELFPIHWRLGCMALTASPNLTTGAIHIAMDVASRIGLDKRATRRRFDKKTPDEKG